MAILLLLLLLLLPLLCDFIGLGQAN